MAAPHVAGVIAVRLGHQIAESVDPSLPADIETWIKQVATPNLISNPGTGSPNLLLYSPYTD